MLIVLSVAVAAALVVVAYTKLKEHSPEAGTAGLRAVRDLADVVIVCVKAVEGVVDVLSRSARGPITAAGWGEYGSGYPYEPDFGDERL